MARVNHKKIKQLIAEKQKSISDRQFFASRILAGHFVDLAAAQTRRYGYQRQVGVRLVWEPKNDNSACTTYGMIWINAGHSIVTQRKGRQARYDIVCGLFAHELGHLLYTDFLARQSHGSYLAAGSWYPRQPLTHNYQERVNAGEILDYGKGNALHQAMLYKLSGLISNVIEDGYVENRMLNRYPGVLGESLSIMREEQFAAAPTLSDLKDSEEEGSHIWLSILQLLLHYVLWGKIKYGDVPLSDERIQVVFSLLNDLDRSLLAADPKERFDVVNTILVRCWPYIKSFLELCEEQAEQASQNGEQGESADGMLEQFLTELVGTSQAGEGDTTPVSEANAPPNTAAHSARRQATARQAAAGSGAGEQSADPAEQAKEESAEQERSVSAQESEAGEQEGSQEEQPRSSGENSAPQTAESVSETEKGRLPHTQTAEISSPAGHGRVEHNEAYQAGDSDRSAKELQRLLEKMAERSVEKQLERERAAELNELAQNISYGDAHQGVSIQINRITQVEDEMRQAYREIAPPLLHISKLLQKAISQQLHDRRKGGKQTGLLIGRRLDAHALPRNDGRVFYKNALPNESPELAVALLVDQSGSMCSCDRITYARAAAIILYDFCQALRIPAMVYGHSTSGSGVDLYSYAEFEAIDKDDRYRMMDITSHGSNRDGAALRFVAEQLVRRQADVKLLILVSDGQPADSGYSGTAAEEDLRGIQQEYQRKGVAFVAAAIGDDKETIERIYGSSFMDISDLSRLPMLLTDVVRRHIRL